MFTGIVEEIGRVAAAAAESGGRTIEIEAPGIAAGLAVGDSVSVAGACQTVTAVQGERFRVYAMGETLRATTLGRIEAGDAVNLERALTPTSRLGGHFVTGHVDGVAEVLAVVPESGWTTLRLRLEPGLAEQLVPKGSLAVDGVSLTVGPEIEAGECELYLIPHTLAATTLGSLAAGDGVNIETDILGKYVERYMERGEGGDGRLLGLLRQQGFLGKRD
jgi:riboflavin synthase